MDISYSVNKNWGLLKSYRDKNDVVRSGSRIWGLRVAQVSLDFLSVVLVAAFVFLVFKGPTTIMIPAPKVTTETPKVVSPPLNTSNQTTPPAARADLNTSTANTTTPKPMKIDKTFPFAKHKAMVWAAISGLELVLSASGCTLFYLAKMASKPSQWEVNSGIYHWANAHVIMYGLVLGCRDILNEDYVRLHYKNSKGMVIVAFLAGGCSFITFLLHFTMAFFPTPFPLLLRGQTPSSSGQDTKGKDETFVDARLSQSGTIDNPNNSGETLETPAAAGTASSSDQVPSATPSATTSEKK